MAEIHKCGQSWAYCDGNCTTCSANNYYTTNGTITIPKDYPPCLDRPKERKKPSNADNIRQMSDEELASFMEALSPHNKWSIFLDGKRWLEWLKQEV